MKRLLIVGVCALVVATALLTTSLGPVPVRSASASPNGLAYSGAYQTYVNYGSDGLATSCTTIGTLRAEEFTGSGGISRLKANIQIVGASGFTFFDLFTIAETGYQYSGSFPTDNTNYYRDFYYSLTWPADKVVILRYHIVGEASSLWDFDAVADYDYPAMTCGIGVDVQDPTQPPPPPRPNPEDVVPPPITDPAPDPPATTGPGEPERCTVCVFT